MEIRRIYIPSVYTNCYVLADETTGRAAVIDPGDDITSQLRKLLDQEGWTLEAVYLTHGHFDHVGGVAALRGAFPTVPVYLHSADMGSSDPLLPTAGLGELTAWQEGDVLSLGELSVEVLHTPGHTPGSVTLRCGDVLFTGDTLFAGSCGRTDFPGGDGLAMLASLKRLAQLEGDYAVYPGHNNATTLDKERQYNPYVRQSLSR